MERLLGFLVLAFFVYYGVRLIPYLFKGVVEGINVVVSEPQRAVAFLLGLLFFPYLIIVPVLPVVAGLIFFEEAGAEPPVLLLLAFWIGGMCGAMFVWRTTVYRIRVKLNPSIASSDDGI